MYIPPCFDFIACMPMDENILHSWAIQNGGVWQPLEGHGRRVPSAVWHFERGQSIQIIQFGPFSEEYEKEWAPLMHAPPLGIASVFFWDDLRLGAEYEPFRMMLHAMFRQWDSYACDWSCHDWVSKMLDGWLPPERIIRYESPLAPPLDLGGRHLQEKRGVL